MVNQELVKEHLKSRVQITSAITLKSNEFFFFLSLFLYVALNIE